MLKTRRGQRQPTPLLLGEEAPYTRCGTCSRCRTGVGRDQRPGASDCWADALDRATRRPA